MNRGVLLKIEVGGGGGGGGSNINGQNPGDQVLTIFNWFGSRTKFGV